MGREEHAHNTARIHASRRGREWGKPLSSSSSSDCFAFCFIPPLLLCIPRSMTDLHQTKSKREQYKINEKKKATRRRHGGCWCVHSERQWQGIPLVPRAWPAHASFACTQQAAWRLGLFLNSKASASCSFQKVPGGKPQPHPGARGQLAHTHAACAETTVETPQHGPRAPQAAARSSRSWWLADSPRRGLGVLEHTADRRPSAWSPGAGSAAGYAR